ncbi:phage tail tape measure protein [Streptomyces sp. NPDC052000]|uniref:phage tail tape measure protein n=1 Tax=Streptomyces sp. NPDC052000 TaxID=3155676 RepID=UPI00344B6755
MAESFLPPVIVELGAKDTGAIKTVTSLGTALARLPEPAQAAADAFKIVLDAAIRMGDGIAEPMDVAKTAIRSVATALRALTKAAAGLDESGTAAMDGVAASAEKMGVSVTAAANEAKVAVAGLGAEFKTAAAGAAAAAKTTTAASEESAAASKAAGDAAAASATKSGAALEGTAAGLHKYAMGLAVAGFGVFEAIKGASKFNTEMTKLNTQANVSQGEMKSLGQGVLGLAGQVGFSPDSLAEALFHVESSFASTGITGQKAMEILKTAAEGAKIGGANLVDVQNALDAAVASGIPGVENFSQAMGQLNAIVGSGDMKMEDLAKALGTGVLAVVKGYGLSLKDVGAALATFGDNNIRGAVAATDLRVAVQSLAVPAKGGIALLKEWGYTQHTLADDMQKGGLGLALNHLQEMFKKAGISATEQGGVITEMFGKKAGAGLAVLMGQLDRYNSKYPELTKSANTFGDAWQTTSHTIGTAWDGLKSGLEALGIRIGEVLLPPLSKFLGWIRDGVSWITQHKIAMEALAAVIGGVLVAALWSVAAAIGAATIEIDPILIGITAVAAAVIYAYTHFKIFREIVNAVGRVLKDVFEVALRAAAAVIHWFATTILPPLRQAMQVVINWFVAHKQDFINAWNLMVLAVHHLVQWFDQNVLAWVRARIADLVTWWHAHSAEIQQVWHVLFLGMQVAVRAWWADIKIVLAALAALWQVVWGVLRDTVIVAWRLISGTATLGMHAVMNVISVILDLITGHWSKAWHDLTRMAYQGLQDLMNLIASVGNGFGNLLYNAGQNIIQGLINGIWSMVGAAGNAISGIVSNIKAYVPWSPAKKGPLSGSGAPEIGGRNITKLLAKGIDGGSGDIEAAMGRITGKARASLAVGVSGGLGGSLSTAGLALAGAAGGGSAPTVVINLTVQGSVLSERDLRDVMQQQMLQLGARNSQTWQPYHR